ncbi:unnamed protein product [Lactuca saligna]|uniref:Uncharacterized protein n=1 Tax=Lactuca saligna TaxID=75948 RepID=A0AA35V0S3_LACSI|nr:unnamed protein product [Lactuca saligna]
MSWICKSDLRNRNKEIIKNKSQTICVVKTDLPIVECNMMMQLGSLMMDQVGMKIEKAMESDDTLQDLLIYGANLTFVDFSDVTFYEMEMKGQKPVYDGWMEEHHWSLQVEVEGGIQDAKLLKGKSIVFGSVIPREFETISRDKCGCRNAQSWWLYHGFHIPQYRIAVGGGFLFSSSFDKTVNVWSLQGLNRIHTFKGDEHKVMAIVYVNREAPICISADNRGEIFIWAIKVPFKENAFKRLNEEKD